MSKIIIVLVVVLLILVGVVFVLPKKNSTTQSVTTQSQSQKSNTTQTAGKNTVTIQNMTFSPATLTIKAGESVIWTNNDSFDHTATASDGSFDTGAIGSGTSKSVTFTKAGTYAYHCNIHPNMTAKIIVE